MNALEYVRSRSRENWVRTWLDSWTNFRIWIQENGELAAVLTFVGGVFTVLAFKLVFVLALLACTLLLAWWLYAQPESQLVGRQDQSGQSTSMNGHSN